MKVRFQGIPFRDVPCGSVFQYRETYYMKAVPANGKPVAAILETGTLAYNFQASDRVTPVDGEFVVK